MDLEGFDETTIGCINNVISYFKHIRFSPEAGDWRWMRVSGALLGTPEYVYYVHPLGKPGEDYYHVQMSRVGDGCGGLCYLFGVVFEWEGENLKTWAYHNGHLS